MKTTREIEQNRINNILPYLSEDSMIQARFELEKIWDKQTDKEDNRALEAQERGHN